MRNMNKIIEWKFIHAKQKTGVVETAQPSATSQVMLFLFTINFKSSVHISRFYSKHKT